MDKDTIITLDDNTKYALLDEIVVEKKKYFFAIKLDVDDNPTTEYEVFEEEIENDDVYMTIVDDEVKEMLMLNLSEKFTNSITE